MSKEMQKEMAALTNNIADQVLARIEELKGTGALESPKNYSVSNAIQAAKLMLLRAKTGKSTGYKPVLDHCTQDSVAKSLLDMVVQGLSVAKSQGYFIAYGNEVSFQRSYFGTIAVLKRLHNISEIKTEVVHEGETFEISVDESGNKSVNHGIKFECLDAPFVGAYCTIFYSDGTKYTEIMTKKMIVTAWGQSKAYPVDKDGNIKTDSVHGKFTQEMVKKTVLNRAAKLAINTSDDSDLLSLAINDSTATEYEHTDPIEVGIIPQKETPKKQIEKQPTQDTIEEPGFEG